MLPLLLALALAPAPDSVEIDRATFHALTAAAPAEAVAPAWAAERTLSLAPVAGGVLVRASWTLRSLAKGAWFSGHVLGDMPGTRVESVRWNGQPAATSVGPAGVAVAGKVSGRATLEVVAFVPGDPVRGALRLKLMPAARGQITASAPAGQEALLTAPATERSDVAPTSAPLQVGTRFLTGAPEFDLSFGAAPAAPGDAAAVVVARAGLGLTVGDAELRGRGRLVWELRRGAVSAVEFTATGVGADLEVTGAGVRAVQRSGAAVRVELQAPVSTRLELELRWTSPIGAAAEARVPLPQVRFTGVFRAEASLQLARDGEVEAVPDARGWTPSSAAGLPAWGQGLVEGAPTAAFTAASADASGGQLDLLRFVPLPGPPVVVDVAAYTIATSREGRVLMRAHYEVRNERAASLRIRPPRGCEILGVRVAGETAMIARDRDGAWRVPLQRSVDTVAGLLSFPVEVALLGEAVPWDRRERRQLPLPRLDAPVAVTRVTLHLPPGYRSRARPGDGEVVAAFTRGDGITYGLGVGEVGAAEADALFQGAVKRWLGNDFAGAQAELDRLKQMGASNENITRLQGNLDLIAGRSDKQDASVQRRIREQARARAVVDQVEQEKLQKQAAQSRDSGDYQAAERQYRAALAVGDRLARLEQKESVEQSTRNEALRSELASNAVQAKAQESVQRSSKGRFGGRKGARKTGGKASSVEATSDDANSYARDPGASEASKSLPGPVDRDGELDEDTAPAQPFDAPVELPVGGSTRDFTAVIDVAPAAQRDAGERSVEKRPEAPAPAAAKPSFADDRVAGALVGGEASVGVAADIAGNDVVDGANIRPDGATTPAPRELSAVSATTTALAGSSRMRARKAGRVRARDTLDTRFKPASGKKSASDAKREPARPEEPGLAAPKVTASAVSVVVPTLGAAVLYQRLLLPADAEHRIDISAREPLISRDK